MLEAINQDTWQGRRDYSLLLLMMQTGLRLAEVTGLGPRDVVLGPGAHVRCQGKGRKERCTPLTRATARVLRDRREHQNPIEPSDYLFPSSRGGRMSHDAVLDLLAKHAAEAGKKMRLAPGSTSYAPHVASHGGDGVAARRSGPVPDRNLARARVPRNNPSLPRRQLVDEGANPREDATTQGALATLQTRGSSARVPSQPLAGLCRSCATAVEAPPAPTRHGPSPGIGRFMPIPAYSGRW